MGSAQLTLGANLSVAVGPVGRHAEATGVAGNSRTAACYGYAVSRGLFAGVGLDGTCVFTRDRLNHTFYGHPASARQLLSGKISPPVRPRHFSPPRHHPTSPLATSPPLQLHVASFGASDRPPARACTSRGCKRHSRSC